MRAVFVGASTTTLVTAAMLLEHGHEVVIIECDKERIDAVSHDIDCGFLHGDGSKPAVQREADPEHTERLYCLTGNDQANILAALVGRTLGFKHVVCKIDDAELLHLCVELGLEDMVIPSQTIGRNLAAMFEGLHLGDLSARIRGGANMFTFVVGRADAGPLEALKLPPVTRVVCFYRDDRFQLPEAGTQLVAGDEVVLITHGKHLDELVARWGTPDNGHP